MTTTDSWKNSYGCVKCQEIHYEGQPIYREHLLYQSKHGIVLRAGGPWVEWNKSAQEDKEEAP